MLVTTITSTIFMHVAYVRSIWKKFITVMIVLTHYKVDDIVFTVSEKGGKSRQKKTNPLDKGYKAVIYYKSVERISSRE